MVMKTESLVPHGTAPGGLEETRVTAEEVLARVGRGEPIVFVDARSDASWRASDERVPGALRVDPERLHESLPEIPKGRAVVTFCTCPAEASAAKVAKALIARGADDVHPLYGGLEAWQRAGGALESRT
jgi:rhodanese-related sulfurtransferase